MRSIVPLLSSSFKKLKEDQPIREKNRHEKKTKARVGAAAAPRAQEPDTLQLLSVPEVAKLMKLSESFTYQLVSTRRLPAIRISRGPSGKSCWRVSRKTLERWMRENEER
jgi:excisionase family DNA binding protein